MGNYVVQVERDENNEATSKEVLYYLVGGKSKPRGIETHLVESEELEFPKITSLLADETVIENDLVAQSARDAKLLELDNLIADALLIDIDTSTLAERKKLFKIVKLLLVERIR